MEEYPVLLLQFGFAAAAAADSSYKCSMRHVLLNSTCTHLRRALPSVPHLPSTITSRQGLESKGVMLQPAAEQRDCAVT
jgi:hypothetical protein